MDKTQGIFMAGILKRKPQIGKINADRFKVSFQGNNTIDEKLAMMLDFSFWLQEEGIPRVGQCDLYVPLLDKDNHVLTHFANGHSIGDYDLLFRAPYDCAADNYDRQPRLRHCRQPF